MPSHISARAGGLFKTLEGGLAGFDRDHLAADKMVCQATCMQPDVGATVNGVALALDQRLVDTLDDSRDEHTILASDLGECDPSGLGKGLTATFCRSLRAKHSQWTGRH
jgi:hypothetical protein